jgi:hypothetical protein
MKYWEIIADNLKKAGWSLGWVSAVDSNGRTIFRCAGSTVKSNNSRWWNSLLAKLHVRNAI